VDYCLFVVFLLAIVSSVLQFTVSDYTFGKFVCFFNKSINKDIIVLAISFCTIFSDTVVGYLSFQNVYFLFVIFVKYEKKSTPKP